MWGITLLQKYYANKRKRFSALMVMEENRKGLRKDLRRITKRARKREKKRKGKRGE